MSAYAKVKVGSGGPGKDTSRAASGLVPSARERALAGLTSDSASN